MSSNSTDKVREAILRYLYEIHEKARGVKSASSGMRDLKTALKPQGFKDHEIVSNLDYLAQTRWVLKEEEEYPMRKNGVEFQAKNTSYKISEKGINHFQGPSKFQTIHKFENINVTNINGTTVIGESNVVYSQYADLFRQLDNLDMEIQKSSTLKDEDKLSVHADVETIKSQLSKPKPTKEILIAAWKGIEAAATISGVIGLCQTIAPLITHLL